MKLKGLITVGVGVEEVGGGGRAEEWEKEEEKEE